MASPDSSSRLLPITTSDPPVPRHTPGRIAPQPIATPTHGPGGNFTIIASTHIAAPPDTVFQVLLDHAHWPAWNRFVRNVVVNATPPSPTPTTFAPVDQDDGTTYLQKGQAVTFAVHMDAENPASSAMNQGMEITLLEPFDVGGDGTTTSTTTETTEAKRGWRVAWKATSFPSFALRSERVQEVVDDGQGGTEYTCWETMYGPLAYVVKWTQASALERNFRIWGEDLKERAETVAAGKE